MSLTITRHGILDTIQDLGRKGFSHMGINPSGAMDPFAAALANILVGNARTEGVIEIHFPASVYYFDAHVVVAITGADFRAECDGIICPLNTPVLIAAGTTLSFSHPHEGARAYLAVAGGFDIPLWLGSASTHLKAHAGGWQGRKLMKGDTLPFRKSIPGSPAGNDPFDIIVDPFVPEPSDRHEILMLKGPELTWLTDASREAFGEQTFTMTIQSDRMGFRLRGPALHRTDDTELVSSPVTRGTIQLLPDGQLILLMADHQTTGGYPRLGTVISADISRVAQKKPGDALKFQFTDIRTAEQLWFSQQQQLDDLQHQYTHHIRTFFEKNHGYQL